MPSSGISGPTSACSRLRPRAWQVPGLVVALEPDAWLVQLLRRSALEQPAGSASVQVVPAAVASEMSIRTLCLADRSRASNHLAEFGTTQTGGVREQQSVVAVTLDWLLESLPAPSVVKIDVEGAELEVLKGAHRGCSRRSVRSFLRGDSGQRAWRHRFFQGSRLPDLRRRALLWRTRTPAGRTVVYRRDSGLT